jgi:hypothetical protein
VDDFAVLDQDYMAPQSIGIFCDNMQRHACDASAGL